LKSKAKKQRHFIEALLTLLSHCSLGCLFKLVKGLSFIVANSKNQISKKTKQNIALCFVHKSLKEKKQFYKQSVNHTLCSLFEMASLWHQPMDQVLALIKKEEVCTEYRADSGAKIIIVPHFGSWEMMNLWLAEQGTLYALYKPSRSSCLDDYILRKRTRNGAILVPTNLVGLRTLLKGLKAGASVMILPDQKPSKDSAKINAEFYGYEASTSLLIKSLVKKVTCSVYMGSAIRDLKTARYDIQLSALDTSQLKTDDQQSADYLNQQIERFIVVDESQYQWSYQRFSQKVYEQKINDNTNI